MLYQDKQQIDFLPPKTAIYYDWAGYSGFGLDIAGTTASSGNAILKGSNDGITWDTIPTYLDGVAVASNQIKTAGKHYYANISSYSQGQLSTENSFNGSFRATALMTVIAHVTQTTETT